MYAIAFFGLLMMFLSIVMIVNPQYWAQSIITFSKKPYFHPFEIISRALFGIVFVYYSAQTHYPSLMCFFGYMLIAVAIGLSLTPPSKHRQFAVWSADKFKNTFRYAGLGSFLFGAFLFYSTIK